MSRETIGSTFLSLALTCASIVLLLSSFVRTKIIAEYGGADGIGQMTAMLSILATATMLAGGGLSSGFTLRLSKMSEDCKFDIENLRSTLIIASFVLTTPWVIGIAIFSEKISSIVFSNISYSSGIQIISIGVLSTIIISFSQALLVTNKRNISLLITQFLMPLLVMISTIFVFIGDLKLMIPIIIVLPIFLIAVALLIFIRKTLFEIRKFNLKIIIKHLRENSLLSILFIVASLLETVGNLAIISTLNFIDSLGRAGIYSSALALGSVGLVNILSTQAIHFYPKVVELANHHAGDHLALTRKQITQNILVGSIFILPILAFPKEAILIAYTQDFLEASTPLQIIQITFIIKLIIYPLIYTILAEGQILKFTVSLIIPLVSVLILQNKLVSDYGVIGAAYSLLAGSILSMGITFYVFGIGRIFKFVFYKNTPIYIFTIILIFILIINNFQDKVLITDKKIFINVIIICLWGIYMLNLIIPFFIKKVNKILKIKEYKT